MNTEPNNPVQSSERPPEPEHPLILDGEIIPGDAILMVRCMVEELLQVGLTHAELLAMSRDPNYQGLFAVRRDLGDSRMDRLIAETYARIGRHRHTTMEFTGDVQPATLTVGVSGKESTRA